MSIAGLQNCRIAERIAKRTAGRIERRPSLSAILQSCNSAI
jgi:hypothetical protein